jgi:hypothetical protein
MQRPSEDTAAKLICRGGKLLAGAEDLVLHGDAKPRLMGKNAKANTGRTVGGHNKGTHGMTSCNKHTCKRNVAE